MDKTYKLGSRPSKYDKRDWGIKLIKAVFPESFLLEMFRNYDQQVNNCVSQAIRAIFRLIFKVLFGVNMLYGGGRSHTGQGMYPNEAANFAVTNGLAPEQDDRGELEVPKAIEYYRLNKSRLHKAAEKYIGCSWVRLYTVDEIKAAILDTKLPIMFTAAISQWNPDGYGVFPCTSAVHGYHQMLVIGWKIINGVDMAVVFNSWSPDWGVNGECYMRWEDVLRVGDIIAFFPPQNKPVEPDDDIHVEVRRTLRKGKKDSDPDRNGKPYNDVTPLQKRLIALGYSLGRWGADGDFGSSTRTAVKKFQRAHGLKADGVFGDKSFRALDEVEDGI